MEMDSLKFLIGDEPVAGLNDQDLPLAKRNSLDRRPAPKDIDYTEFRVQIEDSLEIIGNEIEEAYHSISDHCYEQVQPNDSILTIGYSSTALEFFKEARKHCEFTVIVAENSPTNSGETMYRKLLKEKVNTVLISDSSVFAYMSRINKVIISTRAIMADGGLITDSGVELVVLAADYHTVPVVVISALYKLTPLYPFDNTTYNKLISPELVLNSKEFSGREKVNVIVSPSP